MKHIKDIEEAYKLLKECRNIFKRLNGDSVVMLKEMERVNNRIDRLIED
jgi:hypothetical protein